MALNAPIGAARTTMRMMANTTSPDPLKGVGRQLPGWAQPGDGEAGEDGQ